MVVEGEEHEGGYGPRSFVAIHEGVVAGNVEEVGSGHADNVRVEELAPKGSGRHTEG